MDMKDFENKELECNVSSWWVQWLGLTLPLQRVQVQPLLEELGLTYFMGMAK